MKPHTTSRKTRSAAQVNRRASLFKNGANQAVRLPQEMRFDDSVREVTIERDGDRLILTPVLGRADWQSFFADPTLVPDDFMADRDRSLPTERDWF